MPDRTHGEKRMEELARKGIHGRVLAFYDRCIRDMSAGADLAILDLGAGSGHVSLWLAAQDCVGSVVAYDKALKYMRELPKHPKIEKRSQGSNTALPFGSDEFDVVICRYVFHHFEQKAESLREVRRVLKPGGLLLLSDAVLPDHSKSVLNPLLHVREQNIGGYLTYHETLRALEDAGLCPVLWRPYTYSYESFAKYLEAVDDEFTDTAQDVGRLVAPILKAKLRRAWAALDARVRTEMRVESGDRGIKGFSYDMFDVACRAVPVTGSD